MINKKIAGSVLLAAGIIILAGCGTKTAQNSADKQKGAENLQNAPVAGSEEKLPAPTGKVDDTVDAIIDGANKEGDQVTNDEIDAKSATADEIEAVGDLDKEL